MPTASIQLTPEHPAASDSWKCLVDACCGMSLDTFVQILEQNWDRQEELWKERRRRNTKDYVRWTPNVGDSIDVRCTGGHYGVDAAGKKWRLPEARDIVAGLRERKGDWLRVTRVEDCRSQTGEGNTDLNETDKEPTNKKQRAKRLHRRTGRSPTGRPVTLHFLVESIPGPAIRWDLPADEGRRELTVYRHVRELHASGVPAGEALEKALSLAGRCRPPFDEQEVRRKVERTYNPNPISGKQPPTSPRIPTQPGNDSIQIRFRDAHLTEADAASIPDLAEWILRAIDGRRDRYAYYYTNNHGEPHPKPTLRASLTASVVEEHILGSPKGIYLVRDDGSVATVVFDVDAHCRSKEEALTEVRRICIALEREGAVSDRNFLVEDSGRGYHLWVFIQPASASHSGSWGAKLLDTLNLKPDPKLRSVIPPATGGIGPRKLGPLVRLPLGAHPKNGARSRFLTLEEVADARDKRESRRGEKK